MDAILALEDGRVFRGQSLGHCGRVCGEVVFNTGMTGYQEILTDPSYRGQIVTLTVPHVGNTGVNPDDPESEQPQASGLIIRSATRRGSSWRSEGELDQYLKMAGVVGIEGLDTRALTTHLRSAGVLRGCLTSDGASEDAAIELALCSPHLAGQDLVGAVSCREPYEWTEGRAGLGAESVEALGGSLHIAVLDFGVKRSILSMLAGTGARVSVLPASSRAAQIRALAPDGIFLSNGPGDPSVCLAQIATIRELIAELPIFGICLGHQLMCRALGAQTFKLKFGHRGINHPVRDERTGRVAITSQNHGYAVEERSLPGELFVTHRSLYDKTVEGVAHREFPLFSVQYHPEAAPGPHDAGGLFGSFMTMMREGNPLPGELRRASA